MVKGDTVPTMRSPAVLLLIAALAAPALGDTVYLVNGNKFEEVVAERGLDAVRIRMPHGEIVLPARVVDRVEASPSTWRRYDERESALHRGRATAAEWLELARWADEVGYERGMTRALLRAAEMEPGLEGLAALMGRIGHVRDDDSGEWLSEETYMRRRGYRLWGGHWLPREEYEDRYRAHREAESRRREDERQERIARAIEALAVAQLSRGAERQPDPEPVETRGPLVAVYSGSYFSFAAAPVATTSGERNPEQATYEDLVRRQPGSLLPLQPRRHSSSSE